MVKIDKDFLESNYFTFDKPIDFKEATYEIDGETVTSTLKIYPILVKDWLVFANCVVVLDLEKNNTNDISIIQMSYLKWLLLTSLQDDSFGKTVMTRLYKLLSLCFKTQDINFEFDEKEKPIITINGFQLTSKDFDYFRKVIMFQNLSYYEEEKVIDADLKKAIDDYNDLMNRNFVMPSLERQVVIVANERHVMEDVIFNMTYRKFSMALSEINGKLDYQINKTAEVSGMVEFKQPIDHWIYKAKKEKDTGFVDLDTVKDKINKANG